MKKINITIAFFVLFNISIGSACELIIRITEKPYPPFFIIDNNGKPGGLSIEIAEALLNEAGCKPVYKPLPWKRALAQLRSGEIHLMLNMTPTEERKEFVNFIGPQLDETVVLVIRKDSGLNITCLDDIKKFPKALGTELGKVYGETFERKKATDEQFAKKIEMTANMESNENKLNTERISGFLGYGYNVYYKIKNDPLYANFTVHPLIIRQDWVYFGFSKMSVSTEMLQRFQMAYSHIEKTGLLENVRKSYR